MQAKKGNLCAIIDEWMRLSYFKGGGGGGDHKSIGQQGPSHHTYGHQHWMLMIFSKRRVSPFKSFKRGDEL